MTVATFGEQLAQDFSGSVTQYGQSMRVAYYKDSYSGTAYDNAYLTASGTNQWMTAFDFPVGQGRNTGEDFKFLAQGRIQQDDRKIFVPPHINLSGAGVKIGIGSPTPVEYAIIPEGVSVYNVQGVDIYKKAYVRKLNTGSLPGEI